MQPFDFYLSQVTTFFSNNIWVGIVLAVIILFFLYKKTATCIRCIGGAVIIVGLFYVMTLLSNSSSTGTKYNSSKMDRAIEEQTNY